MFEIKHKSFKRWNSFGKIDNKCWKWKKKKMQIKNKLKKRVFIKEMLLLNIISNKKSLI